METKAPKRKTFWCIQLIPGITLISFSIFIVVFSIFQRHKLWHYFESLTHFIWIHPYLAPSIVIVFYCIAEPMTLPISYFAIGFGFALAHSYHSIIFGLIIGYLSSMIGIILSGNICFILGWTLFWKFIVDHVLTEYPYLKWLDYAIQAEGLKLVFLLRNIPIPYAYISYGLGATHVKHRDFFFGSFGVGLSMFNYVFIGT